MSDLIVVIAKVVAKKEDLSLIKAEAIKLIEPTRKDDGCIEYHLQQDNANPEIFVFVERWQSKKHLQAHLESKHLQNFIKAIDKHFIEFTVSEMSLVE